MGLPALPILVSPRVSNGPEIVTAADGVAAISTAFSGIILVKFV